MTINLKKTAVVALLTICGVWVAPAMAQQTSGPQTRSVAMVSYGGDMAALVSHLPRTFGVTIGLELDPQKPNSYIEVYVREATLTDVLNAIVKSEPRYCWREGEGAIEISPAAGGNPLLDVMIKSFRVTDVDQEEAINQLLNLPEVQSGMRAMNLHRRALNSAPAESKGEKFSLSLQGVAMRQALDRIAKESGQFWSFRSDSNGIISISSSIR